MPQLTYRYIDKLKTGQHTSEDIEKQNIYTQNDCFLWSNAKLSNLWARAPSLHHAFLIVKL